VATRRSRCIRTYVMFYSTVLFTEGKGESAFAIIIWPEKLLNGEKPWQITYAAKLSLPRFLWEFSIVPFSYPLGLLELSRREDENKSFIRTERHYCGSDTDSKILTRSRDRLSNSLICTVRIISFEKAVSFFALPIWKKLPAWVHVFWKTFGALYFWSLPMTRGSLF